MRRSFFLIGMILGIILLPLCLISALEQDNVSEERTLYIGFSSENFSKGSVKEVEVAIEALANELNEKTSARFTKASAIVFSDISSMKKTLTYNKMDIAGLIALEFVEIAESIPMTPFFVASYFESPYFELVVLVRNEDSFQNIYDLKDMSLTIDTFIKEQITKLWIDVLLLREVLPEKESFFSEIKSEEKASKAILQVFFGKVDACVTTLRAFNTMVELNPQVGERLRVLRQSRQLLAGVVCVRKHMPEDERISILDTLESIHTTPEGKQLLMIMKIDRLAPFKAEYLQTTKNLVREYEKLRVSKSLNGNKTER